MKNKLTKKSIISPETLKKVQEIKKQKESLSKEILNRRRKPKV